MGSRPVSLNIAGVWGVFSNSVGQSQTSKKSPNTGHQILTHTTKNMVAAATIYRSVLSLATQAHMLTVETKACCFVSTYCLAGSIMPLWCQHMALNPKCSKMGFTCSTLSTHGIVIYCTKGDLAITVQVSLMAMVMTYCILHIVVLFHWDTELYTCIPPSFSWL